MSNTLISQYAANQRFRGFSRRTIARRIWSLSHWHCHLTVSGVDWDTATVDHLEMFLSRYATAQTRYSVRSDIRQCYRFAIRRGLLACADPTDILDPPKLPERQSTAIDADEVRMLIGALDGADRLAVMLAAHAGLRTSEIAAVRGEDIDLKQRWLSVIGKGDREEVLPIGAALAAELARWPRRGRLLPWASGPSVGNRIRTLLRRHGIEGRPHDLRHSFANAALAASGDNVPKVQRLMRHRQITTTMGYLKPPSELHEIVDRLYDDGAAAA